MHTICKSINNRIRSLRLDKGYSQEYMAFRLQISQQSYSRLESGRQDWKITQLADVATVLEVHLPDLIREGVLPESEISAGGIESLLTKLHQSLDRLTGLHTPA
jgi:transcriptional regulator with XRE-family HTH domain